MIAPRNPRSSRPDRATGQRYASVVWLSAALSLGLAAGPALAEKSEHNPTFVWQKLTQQGAAAFQRGDLAEAQKNFQAALLEAEKFDPKGQMKVDGLMNLAESFYFDSNGDGAQDFYQQALDLAQKIGSEDPRTVTSLSNLADVFFAEKIYGKAERLYRQAITLAEGQGSKAAQQLANSQNDLANLYYMQEKYSDAEPLYKQALAARERAYGQNSDKVADISGNLGMLYAATDKYEDAEAAFNRALDIRKAVDGKASKPVAQVLEHLSDVYRKEKKIAQAEEALKQALAIEGSSGIPAQTKPSTVVVRTAKLYLDQGQTDKAVALLEPIAISSVTTSTDAATVAEAQSDLANIYMGRGKVDDAVALYEKALDNKKQAFGTGDPRVVFAMEHLEEFYKSHGKYDQAKAILNQLLALASAPVPADAMPPDVDLIGVYEDLGEVAQAQGQPAQAESFYTQELRAAQAVSPQGKAALKALSHLADLHKANNQAERAAQYSQQAQAIADSLPASAGEPAKASRTVGSPYLAMTPAHSSKPGAHNPAVANLK